MTVRCVPVLAQGVPVLVQGVPVSARVYHIWYTAGPLVLMEKITEDEEDINQCKEGKIPTRNSFSPLYMFS